MLTPTRVDAGANRRDDAGEWECFQSLRARFHVPVDG